MVATVAPIRSLRLPNFQGGLNLRDSPIELAANESPDCMNVTLDERGGAVKRLGLAQVGTATPDVASTIFWCPALQTTFLQCANQLYKTTTFTTFTPVGSGFSSSKRCAMCEFLSELVVVHPDDGVFTYDGTTLTNRSTVVKGHAIAAWQNKVWVANDVKPRVMFSAIGDAHTWSYVVGPPEAGDYVYLREKDDTPVTALGPGQGMDDIGRPGLLVYKAESAYRINNAASGAYTMLHAQYGAGGPLAIFTLAGLTAAFCKWGISVTDGVNPLRLISERIEPIFRDTQINMGKLGLVAAGRFRDRFVFSYPLGAGAATNTATLEYHPSFGWIVPHSFAAAAYADYAPAMEKLYGVLPSQPKVFETFRGGADLGDPIASRFQTRWFELAGGYKTRLRRIIAGHRGPKTVYVKRDYERTQGQSHPLESSTTITTWNAFNWNDGSTWGAQNVEVDTQLWALGVARAFSFEFVETSSLSVEGAPILEGGAAGASGFAGDYGDGDYGGAIDSMFGGELDEGGGSGGFTPSGGEVGAWAVYSLLLDFVPLGLA